MQSRHTIATAFIASAFTISTLAAQGVIHTFKQKSTGVNPYAGLVSDAAGNLYGVTLSGGTNAGECESSGCGTAFQLRNNGSGSYIYTMIYAFAGGAYYGNPGVDAANPDAPLAIDSAGNLYGTSCNGGISGTGGTVFEISTQAGGGGYTEKVLYNFAATPSDSSCPQGLVLDSPGNLYGTAR